MVQWRASTPISRHFDRGAIDAEYPDGQMIDDLSGSAAITLLRDGEHSLSLSQFGMSYSQRGRSSGLPELTGGTPRDFLPYFLNVRKLN
jgi:hypothetical protein